MARRLNQVEDEAVSQNVGRALQTEGTASAQGGGKEGETPETNLQKARAGAGRRRRWAERRALGAGLELREGLRQKMCCAQGWGERKGDRERGTENGAAGGGGR